MAGTPPQYMIIYDNDRGEWIRLWALGFSGVSVCKRGVYDTAELSEEVDKRMDAL